VAAQSQQKIVAGVDDAASSIQNEIAGRIALEIGENFIEDRDFLGEEPAFSREFSRCSMRSSQQTDGWPACARRLVQKVLPAPDMPIRASRSGAGDCSTMKTVLAR
jgi:hypothetical protein